MAFSIVSIFAPAHFLAYSTFLGTQLYQTFTITHVAFEALPRSAFTTLQKRLFPIYFRSQSLLLLLVVATTPPHGPFTLVQSKADLACMLVAALTAGLNLVVFGPRTSGLMVDRVHQATRDVKLQLEVGVVSVEMRKLNRAFSRAHAMSIHLNLITIGTTIFYGLRLSAKMRFDAV